MQQITISGTLIDDAERCVDKEGRPYVRFTVTCGNTATGVKVGGPVTITARYTAGGSAISATAKLTVKDAGGIDVDTGWNKGGSEVLN